MPSHDHPRFDDVEFEPRFPFSVEQSTAEPGEFCPGCGESVNHPTRCGCYADGVRMIGQALTGWHNVCAEAAEGRATT